MKRSILLTIGAAIAALSLSAAAQAPLSDAEADASAITACMAGSSDAKVANCILGVVALKAIAKGGGGAAQPVIVQQGAQSRGPFLDTVFGILQVGKEVVQTLGPTAAQVIISRNTNRTQERLGEQSTAERMALYNTLGTMNTQSVGAVRDTAGLGFTSNEHIAARIGQPGPTYNVSGDGNGFGAGGVTYNPITGSYNPVNPAPTVVTCTGTPPTCTR